jgi:hypothetical protein
MSKLSGYMYVNYGDAHGLPYVEAAKSLLGFCDEVVVVCGQHQESNTLKKIDDIKLKVYKFDINMDDPLRDGKTKQLARELCTGDIVFQLDADECVHEDSYKLIREHADKWAPQWTCLCYPSVDLYGDAETAVGLSHFWKWRLSLNKSYYGHGVLKASQAKNSKGQDCSLFDDGCVMIDLRTHEAMPYQNYYNAELDMYRTADHVSYAKIHNDVIWRQLPVIWHYGAADIFRKLKMNRDSWAAGWRQLRPDGNAHEVMTYGFDPTGMSDEQLEAQVAGLKQEGLPQPGWWTFKVEQKNPALMRGWLETHGLWKEGI